MNQKLRGGLRYWIHQSYDNPSHLFGGVYASTLECTHINLYVGASGIWVEVRGQPQVLLLRSHHLVLLLIGLEVANWARLARSQGFTEFHLPTARITRSYLHILPGFTVLPINFNSLLNRGINFCSPAKVGKRSQKQNRTVIWAVQNATVLGTFVLNQLHNTVSPLYPQIAFQGIQPRIQSSFDLSKSL